MSNNYNVDIINYWNEVTQRIQKENKEKLEKTIDKDNQQCYN